MELPRLFAMGPVPPDGPAGGRVVREGWDERVRADPVEVSGKGAGLYAPQGMSARSTRKAKVKAGPAAGQP